MPPALDASSGRARLLSAFYGLDNGLPVEANRLCLGASGQDGMPVVLSHTIDPDSLQREDFRVFTRSGAERTPFCVTLAPARDAGELRTVLLIGEFGDADDDPPVKAFVVGDLLSDGMPGSPVNFRGAETHVIPLEAGPTLVLAEVVSEDEWSASGRGSTCSAGSQQVVRATWTGGVRLPNGDDPGDAERQLYRVTVERPDGSREEIAPVVLADLGDNDNNHFLCLDTTDPAVSVAFPAGHLVDPNRDLNPETRVAITTAPTAGAARSPSLNLGFQQTVAGLRSRRPRPDLHFHSDPMDRGVMAVRRRHRTGRGQLLRWEQPGGRLDARADVAPFGDVDAFGQRDRSSRAAGLGCIDVSFVYPSLNLDVSLPDVLPLEGEDLARPHSAEDRQRSSARGDRGSRTAFSPPVAS